MTLKNNKGKRAIEQIDAIKIRKTKKTTKARMIQTDIEVPSVKKRGRPGRPPKEKTIVDIRNQTVNPEIAPAPKKRGRPRKVEIVVKKVLPEGTKIEMSEQKTTKKPVYIRCPRCELNYCLKKDKYCSVCRAEMAGEKDSFADELELELCPICKTNYIQPDEIMCASCLKERQNNGESIDDDEEWSAYANREDEDDYSFDDEETGDMASINDIDDDVLGNDLVDDDLAFDIDLDPDVDDIDEEEEEDFEDDEDDFESVDADDYDEEDDDED